MKMNVLHRGLLIFVVGTLLSFTASSQTKGLKLTAKDKSEIVKSVLNQFLEDYPDEIQTDEIILSSLNINPLSTSLKSSLKLTLLSPEKIDVKIRQEGFVDYLVFSKFKVENSKVIVTLESLHSVEHKSEIIPVFGHGFVWESTKKSGRWTVECIDTSAFTTTLDIGTGQ